LLASFSVAENCPIEQSFTCPTTLHDTRLGRSRHFGEVGGRRGRLTIPAGGPATLWASSPTMLCANGHREALRRLPRTLCADSPTGSRCDRSHGSGQE